mmetsp:Transcript_16981/g.26158  ORF Transcript_16981/g.26158 Transcript_16981/m.26158 type:complete len:374 (+) Transcript_16981:675-1796(+)|eukprot:CAMPEP_0170494482 /NCGR_PEP_ID=MMETSP0208-20121228/14665_1 /TAXON_ID=197538 /ORGANISM="Strombidium inclinatum, Strain S3" /LENGTH=373 /DNA_ID=CAMNT_0010770543 /DNA_START=675 /DNA_END=1796 /DNA_ORIENTATION=-
MVSVDHPNIIMFHECYLDLRYIHIVMELATGGELFEKVVESQFFSERKASNLMRKMLSAIQHLHENQICHRDLKPENFLFSDRSEDAEIKLIDFGLSKRFGTEEEKVKKQKMQTIVGTPYYVAPEVLRGKYDKSCDIWSLGIILYILLCGYPPFEGDNDKEIFKNVLNQKLVFDPKDWNNVSKDAKDLITNMLDKNPSTRISAQQCLDNSWFKKTSFNTPIAVKESIVKKLRDFRAPKKLQLETLKFLVNNLTVDIDFKALREAFSVLDTTQTGFITPEQIKLSIKQGMAHDNHITHIDLDEIDRIFARLDINKTGRINYSEFLIATVDKQTTLTQANVEFAFHHFDTDNKGYITKNDLKEVFKRQGNKLTDD